jgi:hypothetical protein
MNRGSSVDIVTRLRAGRPGFVSWQGKEIFVFPVAFRPALRFIQPFIQWVPWVLSPGVKPEGHEADRSPLSNAKVSMELYLHSPIWLLGIGLNYIIKYTDNFN